MKKNAIVSCKDAFYKCTTILLNLANGYELSWRPIIIYKGKYVGINIGMTCVLLIKII